MCVYLCVFLLVVLFCSTFAHTKYVYNTVEKSHFPEANYQFNRIKASVNNDANPKISGDSRCLIAEATTSICKYMQYARRGKSTITTKTIPRSSHLFSRFTPSPIPLAHIATHWLPFFTRMQEHSNSTRQIITICTHILMYENLF